ncbi:MAG: carbonic anhydrase family protein [Burkholderiales bacterium]
MLLFSQRLALLALHLSVVVVCVTGPAAAQAGSLHATDPMDAIRERLAAKLGAVPESPSAVPGVLKVSSPAVSASAATAEGRPAQRVSSPAGQSTPTAASGGARRAAQPAASGSSRWAYEGEHGPAAWARLAPENATCASGQRQSPIDITDGIKVDLDAVQFDYRPSGFRVVDTGHTVQVNVAPGNTIEVLGKHFELVQFHFHRPSEERIDGKPFDMVVHLLHKSTDGKVAMIAVLLERGSAQPVVQAVWNNLPLEKGDEVSAKAQLDPTELLPSDRRYYTYMGSLTTPPCSEGVLWMVMKTPVQISPEQLKIFARLYPMNARPVQALQGRTIKESN